MILYDGNTKLDKEQLLQDITGGRHAENVQVLLGELPDEVLDTLTLVVIQSGSSYGSPNRGSDAGETSSDSGGRSNLLIHMEKGKFLRLPGTNGKNSTTTAQLLGKIIGDWHPHTFVVGNIGNPYTSVVEEMPEDSVTVAEMSSFQLETIQ